MSVSGNGFSELRKLLLKAHGEASSFKMIDTNAVNLEEELKAAKATGIQLEGTLKETLSLLKKQNII
jgi:hypothetical protein